MNQDKRRVALCLVSHSRSLAEATRLIAKQMTGNAVIIEYAAGVGSNGEELGTDTLAIAEVLSTLNQNADIAGIVVLMDVGSAILSTEAALEILDGQVQADIRLSAGPFVEGAIAAAVRAAAFGTLDEVLAEAQRGLVAKMEQLGFTEANTKPTAPALANVTGFSVTVEVADRHGLHARPAARLSTRAADYDAAITVENLTRGQGRLAPVSSPIALASLGARHGHLLRINASGPDAEAALEGLAALLRLDPEGTIPAADTTSNANEPTRGLPIVAGIAIGPLITWQRAALRLSDHNATDIPAELERLRAAVERVSAELRHSFGQDDMAAVHEALLRDPELIGRARKLIEERHFNAAWAWNRVVLDAAGVISELDDPYLRAREADVRDVGLAVSQALCGVSPGVLPEGPPCIVLVEDLLPSEVARLDPARVLGILDRRNGATSHTAILLRGAGIPAVFGACAYIGDTSSCPHAALDGETGEVWLDPDAEIIQKLEAKRSALNGHRERREIGFGSVSLSNSRSVELWANVAGLADARAAREASALGIGLLRTEMLFLDRQKEPSEEEQADLLTEIVSVFPDAPVVIRTLDAGGDKALPYLRLPQEANPSLGIRGLRLSLGRPAMFEAQLRAILRVASGRDVRIMFPMVTNVSEIVAARSALVRAHEALVRRGVKHTFPIPIGIMIEIPAAAWIADRLSKVVDFFSIGTNDLTQYTLAAERGQVELSDLADPAHPAVLALVHKVIMASNTKGIATSICGEAAADPALVMLYVGLGISRLSMGAGSLSRVREALLGKRQEPLEEAAQRALLAEDAITSRSLGRALL